MYVASAAHYVQETVTRLPHTHICSPPPSPPPISVGSDVPATPALRTCAEINRMSFDFITHSSCGGTAKLKARTHTNAHIYCYINCFAALVVLGKQFGTHARHTHIHHETGDATNDSRDNARTHARTHALPSSPAMSDSPASYITFSPRVERIRKPHKTKCPPTPIPHPQSPSLLPTGPKQTREDKQLRYKTQKNVLPETIVIFQHGCYVFF